MLHCEDMTSSPHRYILFAILLALVSCTAPADASDAMLASTSAPLTPNGTGSSYAEFTVTEPVAWESICISGLSLTVPTVGLLAHDDEGRATVLALRKVDDWCLTPDLLDPAHPKLLPGMRYTITANIEENGDAEIFSTCAACVQWGTVTQ